MPGYLLLEGGAEFGGAMQHPDRRALELAGGLDAPVVIIPTAAAPDNNHHRAGVNGLRWFQGLGARQVQTVPLVDRASAADPAIIESLRAARLIYLLGGFTHYLGQTLMGSPAWQVAQQSYTAGAILAGSSAGAMVLCEMYFNPASAAVQPGLNLVPNACVLPHHNTFGSGWVTRLRQLLPQVVLLGIDERTGMLDDGPGGAWQVYGQGAVTIYRPAGRQVFTAGQSFRL